MNVALEVANNGVVLENLSTRSSAFEGVLVSNVERFMAKNVKVYGGTIGVHLRGASMIGLHDVVVTDAISAGVVVRSCEGCGVTVDQTTIVNTPIGLMLDTVSGVVVRRINSLNNGTGIRVSNSYGVDVASSLVQGGTISIEVDALARPTFDVRVFDNQVEDYSSTGLRWNLLGVRVCFSNNVDPTTGDRTPVSQPPLLQTLFPCPGGTAL